LIGVFEGALALIPVGIHVSLERVSVGLVAHLCREAVEVPDVVWTMLDEEFLAFLGKRFPPGCALSGSPVGVRERGNAGETADHPNAARVGVGADRAKSAGELAVDALCIIED
jgi:hypothetical protein